MGYAKGYCPATGVEGGPEQPLDTRGVQSRCIAVCEASPHLDIFLL